MANIPDPFPGKVPGDPLTRQEVVNAARLAIIAEQEAIALYDKIAEMVPDPAVKQLMKDLSDEEQVHVGELLKLVGKMDPDDPMKIEEGESEAEEKIRDAVVSAFLNGSK